jgi:hypothetical protein
MSRNSRRREPVLPSMAPVSSASVELGNPRPGLYASQGTAREGPPNSFDLFQALLAARADQDPLPRRWPKLALFAACLAVLAAGWWFYRDDAGYRSARMIQPALAGEVPATPNQATKPAELDGAPQQAEWLSKTYEELLEKKRRLSAALDQKLATREKDGQLLVQERARTKELEEQLSARQSDQAALVQERARSKDLERQLAARQSDQAALVQERARSKDLEQQLAARQSDQAALVQERARSKDLEWQLAARQGNQEPSVEERALIQGLEQRLAVANLPSSLFSFTPAWPEWAPANNPERPSPTALDATVMGAQAAGKSAPVALVPAPPDPEAARLMVRAKALLEEGDIGGARVVLRLAADSGSALALFMLAETYDPAVLSSWGTFGTQSDDGTAQQLYAKAFAAGFQEAKGRMRE